MLTLLDIALLRYPALESFEHTTRTISRFLGPPPNLLLSEACEHGSIAMLDWIWTASCTATEARTPGWSLTNYLRSDPLNYRWQFAKSLYAAAERGDLVIVEWLFAHFSGCEAPANVVKIAERRGNLQVLRFLWEHRSRGQNEAMKTERFPRGNASDCTVQFDSERCNYDYDGKYWGEMVITKAAENGQLAQCLDDGMQLAWYDRVTAIKEAMHLGDFELAERLVPFGESILQYVTDCAQPEVISRLLDEGYLQWNEERAAVAFRNVAESGSCEMMQQIFQLHSPLQADHSHWKGTWWEAVKAACSGGNLCVLKWLVEHPLGEETCDELKQKTPGRRLLIKSCPDAATNVFDAAATKGHIEVLQFLYEKGIASLGPFTKRYVIEKEQLNSVKWFVDHGVIEAQKPFSCPIDHAAHLGVWTSLNCFKPWTNVGVTRGWDSNEGVHLRYGMENDIRFSGQLWAGMWPSSSGYKRTILQNVKLMQWMLRRPEDISML